MLRQAVLVIGWLQAGREATLSHFGYQDCDNYNKDCNNFDKDCDNYNKDCVNYNKDKIKLL